MASLVKALGTTRVCHCLGALVASLAATSPALAQCGASACSVSSPVSFSPPPYAPPSSAQELILESRRSATAGWQTDFNIPKVPFPVQSAEHRSADALSMQVVPPARTWTNGDGLWQISPTGSTCQVSVTKTSAPNASPCGDAF